MNNDYDGTQFIHQKRTDFGERKLVTMEMLATYFNNDEYLYRDNQALWDNTPPVTRKRFTPVPCDQQKSFSVAQLNSQDYGFSQSTEGTVSLRFANQIIPNSEYLNTHHRIYMQALIDWEKSTATLDTHNAIVDNKVLEGGTGLLGDGRIVCPYTKETYTNLNKETRNYSPWSTRDEQGNIISDDMTCNEYWYVSFDRDRTYETRPNWLSNLENGEIPAICRAQTFKAKTTGDLETVVLNINGGFNTGSPLIVEITEAEYHQDDNCWYPASRNSINNARYNTNEYGPYTSRQLAKREIQFNTVSPGVISITFDQPAKVIEGHMYAIVIRSPLTHQTTAYYIGGWSKHCDADVYPDGDAFMSSNNGYNWIRYGKEDNVDYHAGRFAPQDFAFQCHIREYTVDKYYLTVPHYIYTKPVHCNPLTSIHLNQQDNALTGTIIYELTTDGDTWVQFDENGYVDFEDDENPTMFILRAKLTPGDRAHTPYISNISLHLSTLVPDEAVLRTIPYTPRVDGILGASVYSSVNAKYSLTNPDLDTVNVDIVREVEMQQHFSIISFDNILEYVHLMSVWDDYDELTNIIETTDNDTKHTLIISYFNDNPEVIQELKDNKVYILEYLQYMVTLSGSAEIQMSNSPAYPLIQLLLQPKTGSTIQYSEWLDYTVDYTEDTITFKNTTISTFTPGDLIVKYNPLFIQDLVVNEMPLCLDLIREDYILNNEMIEDGVFDLVTRTNSLDPIRSLIFNPDTDNIRLVEDRDFTVDYDSKTITVDSKVLVNAYDDREGIILSPGDVLSVKYTPFLVDECISLMYHMKRLDIADEVRIHPCYFETKT